MDILICNSNLFSPGVLTTVLQNPERQYIIYTDQPEISLFFQELHLENAAIMQYPNNYRIWNLPSVKKGMRKQFKGIPIDSITFYHAEEGHLANWFISIYSRKCKIYYCPPYQPLPLSKAKLSLHRIKICLLNKLLYNFDTDLLDNGGGVSFSASLSPSFLKRNSVIQIEYYYDDCLNNKAVDKFLSRIKISKLDVVLLTGSLITCGVEKEVYNGLVRDIITIVGLNSLVRKCHPLFHDETEEDKKIQPIPQFVPMNVLISRCNVAIGYGTTALVEAAESGKLSISIIKLLNDTPLVKGFIDSMEDKLSGSNKILYPESIDELRSILQQRPRL